MEKQKRKDLVAEYMNTKTEMGIYTYFCIPKGKYYLGVTQNTKSAINGSTFRLNAGNHFKVPNLQADWKEFGENAFEVKVLEVLDYDKDDDMKTDYSVELELLLEEWACKFENIELIK